LSCCVLVLGSERADRAASGLRSASPTDDSASGGTSRATCRGASGRARGHADGSTSGHSNVAPPALAGAPPAPEGETDDRPRGFAPQNSLAGSVGLLRMGSAEVGRLWQLRLGLHGEYFNTNRMLIEDSSMTNGGDTNTRLQGALTFGLTPLEFMEIFGAVLGSGNRNTRCQVGVTPCTREAGWSDPEVIKAFGDLILGTKLAYALPSGLSIGGELGFRLMSSVGG